MEGFHTEEQAALHAAPQHQQQHVQQVTQPAQTQQIVLPAQQQPQQGEGANLTFGLLSKVNSQKSNAQRNFSF